MTKMMHHRVLDSFLHELRAGRDDVPGHDELKQRFNEAIEAVGRLSDGLYKRARAQKDDGVLV
jgi:hypothetical protein